MVSRDAHPNTNRILGLRLATLARFISQQSVSTAVGVLLVWLIFYLANERFLSSVNLTNLILQIAAVGTISIGANLLLLIGEIDLSIGIVSGLSAAVMAVLNVRYHVPALPAVTMGIATGAFTGLVTGALVTTFRIPSFIVSLGGLLAWQGVLLRVIGSLGTINIRDPHITFLTGSFVSQATGAAIEFVTLGAYSPGLVGGGKAAPRWTEDGRRRIRHFADRDPGGAGGGEHSGIRRRPRRSGRLSDLH